MIRTRLFFVVLVVLICSQGMSAQTVRKGRESKMATVNFTELANYYREHPVPEYRKPLFDEDEEGRPLRPPVDPSLVHLLDRSQNIAERGIHTPDLPVSPSPTDSFESTPSDHTGIPPDTHGAVDSQYCVTAINTSVHIQSRAGYSYSYVSLDGFWNPLLIYGPGAFDPRVHYDPNYKRWIMVTDAYGQTGNSMVFVAVSVTNDPTGSWYMYSIVTDATGASWMDFPNVGYNNKWIAITGNMFPNTSSGATGAVVFLIDYASVIAGTGAPYTMYSEPSSFAICPAITSDATEPNLFMLEDWDNTTGKLQLWKVTGSVSSPTLSVVGYPQTSTHWRSGPSGGGNFLPQAGSTDAMESGDDRITSCTYRNHKLWCSHTIFLPASGTTTHSSIMWWQVDTLAHPQQVGLINDPTAGKFYAYSSIAVNANDDALVGFGYFSHSVYGSCGYALHMHTDPADSIRPAVVYRHGLAYYYETYGSGRNRWGDYSATCIDPRNDTDFWTIQETSSISTSPNWDTWWANVQFCPKPTQPTMAFTTLAPCIGASATYATHPVTGATSYVWTVGGTGWSMGSTTSDSATITAGTGIGIISVLAYNSCGEGEAHVFSVTPGIPPHRPHISIYSPACIESPTAVFSGASSGATGFTWVALDSGWSGTGTSTSLTASVGSGTGMIICTATNACGAGIPDTIYVTPAATPVTTYSVVSHIEHVTVSDIITFTGSAPAGSTYTWNFGGGTGVPGTGPGPQSVTWTVPGLKTVTLTVNNAGCTSTFSDTVRITPIPAEIGVIKNSNFSVDILPNPNDGTFDIMFDKAIYNKVTINITDIQGSSVYKETMQGNGSNKLSVITNNLHSGIYVVNIISDGIVTNRKITITK